MVSSPLVKLFHFISMRHSKNQNHDELIVWWIEFGISASIDSGTSRGLCGK